MPQWSDHPTSNGQLYAFRIVRTPATGSVDALCTSPGLHGCPTHFVSNRTIPCEGSDACKLCAAGHSWRWHGYVSCVLVKTNEHVLFECTAQAADTFATYLCHNPSLIGCHFLARRPSGRQNGRVIIQARTHDLSTARLPDPPNVRRILCHIWGVQYTESTETPSERRPFHAVRVHPSTADARYDGNGDRFKTLP